MSTLTREVILCKNNPEHGPAHSTSGIYAKLCTACRQVAMTERQASTPQPAPDGADFATRVRALVPLARTLDRAVAKVAALGDNKAAQEEFDAAMIAAAEPGGATPAALERLESATKVLRKGAPTRAKLEGERNRARLKLDTELRDLWRDVEEL